MYSRIYLKRQNISKVYDSICFSRIKLTGITLYLIKMFCRLVILLHLTSWLMLTWSCCVTGKPEWLVALAAHSNHQLSQPKDTSSSSTLWSLTGEWQTVFSLSLTYLCWATHLYTQIHFLCHWIEVLTYSVCCRIHYPLPLPYLGKPDPAALQKEIRALRAELTAVTSHGVNRSTELEIQRLRTE